MMAMTSTLFVTLVGFYIIKNCIERDSAPPASGILAATPLTRLQYLLGKWLSNFAALTTILLLLAACGIVVQLWRATRRVSTSALLLPFLILSLPAMAALAAWAVLFETVPGLRGGFGNVAWFFVWAVLLVVPIETDQPWADMSGGAAVQKTLIEEARRQFPDYKGEFQHRWPRRRLAAGEDAGRRDCMEARLVLPRAGLFGIAFLLVGIASLFFNRFDPAGRFSWRPGRKRKAAAARRRSLVRMGARYHLPSAPPFISLRCRRISGKPPRASGLPPPR